MPRYYLPSWDGDLVAEDRDGLSSRGLKRRAPWPLSRSPSSRGTCCPMLPDLTPSSSACSTGRLPRRSSFVSRSRPRRDGLPALLRAQERTDDKPSDVEAGAVHLL